MASPLPSVSLVISGTCVATSAYAVSARVFGSERPLGDRVCGAFIFAAAACIGVTCLLGYTHVLYPWGVFAATLAVCATALVMAGSDARRLVLRDLKRILPVAGELLRTPADLLPFSVSCGMFALALSAAFLLPAWTWDSLGYHLPVVYDALQVHGIREVPTGVPYVNAYPRAIEIFFIWWRSHLASDTWLDAAQVPFALSSIATLAAFAHRWGASSVTSISLASLFVAIPVVTMQLPSNYVDIAYASFLLAGAYFFSTTLDTRNLFTGALATGLLLASKPSAPVPVFFLLGGLVLRVGRTRPPTIRWTRVAASAGIVLALGAFKYLENLLRYGNPLWPVKIRIGPFTLPGDDPAEYHFNQGVPEPYLHYGWLRRLLGSWFAHPPEYIYDMRIGGFGPLFVCALLPLLIWALLRRRQRPALTIVLWVALATLATPGAYWARFTLAFPAILLPLAAVCLREIPARSQWVIKVALSVLSLAALPDITRGMTGNTTTLGALAKMSPDARAVIVSIDGHADDWRRARALAGAGECIVYDKVFGLPGQLFREDGGGRVEYLHDRVRGEEAMRYLKAQRARVAVLGDPPDGARDIVSAHPNRFRELFPCPFDPCSVYEVLPDPDEPQAALGPPRLDLPDVQP